MANLTYKWDVALSGEVQTKWRGQTFTLRDPALAIETADGQPTAIRLSAQLDPLTAGKLALLMPGIKERPRAPATFTFAMTPQGLATHGPALAGVKTMEEWISAADGACLKLENYGFESVVTGTTRESQAAD